MSAPDPKQIMMDAERIQSERFKRRDTEITVRRAIRFGERALEVPPAYQKSTLKSHTPAIREEGRHLFALTDAFPVPHLTPPEPEQQAQTTAVEKYLTAMHQELESYAGHVWTKARQAQMHDRLGWVKFSLKRDFYSKAPKAPSEEDEDYAEQLIPFEEDLESYKKEVASDGLWDYVFPPTNTVYYRGTVWNPLAIYEIKDVDEDELVLQYGLTQTKSGLLEKLPPDVTNIADRNAALRAHQPKTIKFIEYWDRDWCVQMIVQEARVSSAARKSNAIPLVLDTWEHKFGRVPYFAMPGFETEIGDPDRAFESPLDALYDLAPDHDTLVTMDRNVAYLSAYPSWQLVTPLGAEQILDDDGTPVTHIEFAPGRFHQNAPGQQVMPLPMQGSQDLARQVQMSYAQMQQYSLSAVTRGVSPGADTANSAIAQLQRLQRSAIDPMLENQAWCARELYRFALKRIKEDIQQTVYALDPKEGETFPLDPVQIPTINVQTKVQPDTGTDDLIEEKQAAEMVQMQLITPLEFHERRGKENPEEYVRAEVMWGMFMAIQPTLQQQVLANLGNTDAIAKMIAANQQTGSAKNAVPGIMQDLQGQQNGQIGGQESGIGQGSPGLPRAMGVRSPNVQTTTQPQLTNGVNPAPVAPGGA